MNHWTIKLEVQRTDNGFNVKANIPTRDQVLRHEGTKEDVRDLFADNIVSIIDDVDANLNPETTE